MSIGTSVRRSTTSTEMPCVASCSAAARLLVTMCDQATRVTSDPGRFTSARPSGTTNPSSSGTSPSAMYSSLCSMKITGSSSRMAAFSRPFASAGAAGITTLSPGMWQNSASRLCECWPASEFPAPPCVRTTSGTLPWPPDMKRYFAAWLTTWSIASSRKSMNSISTTGRDPAIAAPTPSPTNPASLRGVSMTRRGPNCAMRPSVTL